MNAIHVTERATFKGCRRQWKYQYRENLQRPADRMDARWLGKGVHVALAAYYSGTDPFEAFQTWLDIKWAELSAVSSPTSEDIIRRDELTQLASIMLEGYIDYAKSHDDFRVMAVEMPFSIKIPGTRGILAGTIDMVVQRGKQLWVVDHKTYANFADAEALELDDQMTAYLWACWQKYGIMPSGAIYNQLRKKIPAEPMLLKSGDRLSKDKSIDTTREIYLATIRKYGFNPDDYADILDKLDGNEFYRREIIPRNTNELITFGQFLPAEYRDMTSKSTVLYPNPSQGCAWCDYRTLCKSENEGGDTEALKTSLYVVEEGRRL